MSELVSKYQKAQALHQAGNLYSALASYEEILISAPLHADTNHYAGVCLYQLGHYDAAYEKVSKAISLNPNNPVQLNHLALILIENGRFIEAEKFLNQARTLDPNYLDALANLGMCKIGQMKSKDALEILEEVAVHRPDDINVINNIGLVYLALGQSHDAKKHFERGNILSPSNVPVRNNLARTLFDLECIEPAIEILTKLVDEGLATAETYYFLHSAIMQRGNDIAFIKQAYDMKPLDDGIVLSYATALWGRNDCCTAHQIFLDCCEIIKNKEFLQTEPLPKKVPFSPEDAVTALIDLTKVLEPIRGNYWLDFGTLLGFIREGGPLKHDKDADIGVNGNVDRSTFTQLIRNSSNFDLSAKSSLGDQQIHHSLSIVHNRLGVLIDVFFYNQNRDGSFACGFWKYPAAVTWSFDNIPRLGKIIVDGNDFPVPDDPSKHLEKIYGPTWMVPDKLFDTVLSAHNLCRSSLETSTLFGLQRLINSVRTGRIEKAIYYLDVLQDFDANLPLKDLKIRLEKELQDNVVS